MATIEVRDVQGEVVTERELPAEFFDSAVNVPVMHQVVVAGMAAIRAGTHSTKTRGQVSGGGRKPWRQKGTGRARHGSSRSPIWTAGGVAHGPKPRDHTVRVNKRMRRLSLRSALTDAVRSGKLAVVDGLTFDGPRTKDAVSLLDTLGLNRGRVLLVIAEPDEAIEKSFRNLGDVKIDYPGNLSTFDLLYADRVLFTSEALDVLTGAVPAPSPTPGNAEIGLPADAEVPAEDQETEEAEPETDTAEAEADADAEEAEPQGEGAVADPEADR